MKEEEAFVFALKNLDQKTKASADAKRQPRGSHLHAGSPSLHGAGAEFYSRVSSVRAFFLFHRLGEVREQGVVVVVVVVVERKMPS